MGEFRTFNKDFIMKKIILFILCICFSCSEKHEIKEGKGLPYYHTADFTPQWLSEKSQLDTLHTLANFEFKNQNNHKITQDSLKGKVHVACFFFTICPSLCPKIMGNMKVVQDSLKNDKNFLIASYSVMPERDSVATLRIYATDNQIIDNKWHLMTGDKKQIYEIARKSYFADENLGVQKGVNDFLHTENFILVDKKLHIRGIYNGTLQLEIEQLIKDVRELEKE
jgi:protein SCO1